MKIQDDLVWDKFTGELNGFVDLEDVNLNYASLNDVHEIASHVCVFLLKSIVNPLSFSFATFASTGVTSDQLYHLVWRAVTILERTCFLKVVATSCGASPNRAFYRIHAPYSLDGKPVTKARNVYSSDSRFLWIFCDAPHLVKTTRNRLSNSGSGRASRLMWKRWLVYFVDSYHILIL